MRQFYIAAALAGGIAMSGSMCWSQAAPSGTSYKILKMTRVGGEGGFDYIFADVDDRRLYIPRSGPTGYLSVFNLDTLEPVGRIDSIKAGGATVDPKSHHGFSTTMPITMWDSSALKVIKTIDVADRPDGIMFDCYTERVWVLSHAPRATVIDAKEGIVVGTPDLGGGSEQAVSDDRGTIYVNISNNATIAVVDAQNLSVKAHYDVSSKASGGTGLAIDAKNNVLFAYYHLPSPSVVILNAENAKIITTFPTGAGIVDTVAFNPATMEAISADTNGSMTFIKESSPTSFSVEQKLQTMQYAKTLALDTKTNHVFTMSALYGAPPPNAPPTRFGLPSRGPMVPGSFSIVMVGK